ncbi:hypothetical protein [Nonomuraea bangladeshensis]|uniref:hypothetical protein n=1 Tax=Nonomuraea bangladeshensis TaxID=404385 RepID=UPI003C2F101A
MAGVAADEEGAAGAALAAYAGQARLLGLPQPVDLGRLQLVQVQADQLGAAQPGAEQQVDDGPVA